MSLPSAQNSAPLPAQPIFGPPTPWWVRVTLWGNTAGFFIAAGLAFFGDSSDTGALWSNRVTGVLILVPAILVLVGMGERPRIWLFGVVAGIAITSGFVAFVLPAVAALGASVAPQTGIGFLLLCWSWAGVQVCVLVWAARAVHRTKQPLAWRQAWVGLGAVIIWPMINRSIAGSVDASVGLTSFAHARTGLQDLRTAVVATANCAFQYADANPGAAYPASLDAMGPRGTKCLDETTARLAAHYSVHYETTPPTEGTPGTFVVRASTVMYPGATSEILTLLIDTSAAIRRNPHFGTDTIDGIAGDGIPARINEVRDCADLLSSRLGRPPSNGELAAVKDENLTTESHGCYSGDLLAVNDSLLSADLGYRMTYQADAGGFRLVARPVKYGVTALRSYLLDTAGVLHVTREYRPAWDGDPVLAVCAPYDLGDCMPTPSTRPPVAAFVHDSLVRDDQQYVLRVRVAGSPTHIPEQRISWRMDCDVKVPADTTPPARDTFSGSQRNPADVTCSPLRDHTPPIDVLVVRLWLKGPRDVIVRMQDTVRVIHRTPPA